ncbi:MAG: response regulator [Bacteroidetes bacterium]|nr:response regulator [Bacteroidota bacterium]MDA1119167.1 response regulator [Bacteroidota bacterium]
MKKIVLIEDNPDVRENTAEILELADFEVLTAANGKEGVELACAEFPDLIICDIMMPELDGYGVLHILSKKQSTMNIPFIFLTAKAEKSDVRKGMNLGADDYVTKPFDDTELLDAVEARLHKSEMLKQEYEKSLNGLDNFMNDAQAIHNLKELTKERRVRSYKKKKDIFLEGDMPQSLYYVNLGKVKTYKTNDDGKELITGLYVIGDFFGFESLLEGEFGESATALEDTELALVPKNDFLTLIYGNREVSKKFIEILCNKVSEKEKQLLDLAYSTVRQRTATALLNIYSKYGSLGNNIPLLISREDLANMVGTATETVIRVLSDFKDEKLIDIQSGKIYVINTDRLEIVAEKNFAI